MDCRKIYAEMTKCEVPFNFQIHHIDGDRANNDIKNLVALPKSLHSKYHRLKPPEMHLDFRLKAINESGSAYLGWFIQQLEGFEDVYNKCIVWVDYREYLLGNLPNIFKMDYEQIGD